jgi:flagellar protein FliT
MNSSTGSIMAESPASLIQYYEAVAQTSHDMLRAAYMGDWPQVEALEHRCLDLIDALNQASSTEVLDPDGQKRRMALLGVILENDAQIRVCADPWLSTLDDILG